MSSNEGGLQVTITRHTQPFWKAPQRKVKSYDLYFLMAENSVLTQVTQILVGYFQVQLTPYNSSYVTQQLPFLLP